MAVSEADVLLPGRTVLVVEDHSDVGSLLVAVLEEELSCRAILVLDGCQALMAVEECRPDLLLLDYQLPDMNGLALYDRLVETKDMGRVPVVVISANPPVKELQRRNVPYLRKPFELDTLLTIVETLLERSPDSDATCGYEEKSA
jgi:CheY-like chemotaxis protein